MKKDEILSLFNDVFFEDEYSFSDKSEKLYNRTKHVIYLKRYSKKLDKHIAFITISNHIIGTIICDDIWEIKIPLLIGDGHITMKIPGTSSQRNPKDVGDCVSFLYLLKEKITEYFLIKDTQDKFYHDMNLMKNNPDRIVREFKINQLIK